MPDSADFEWDPFGALHAAYHYDYHDARSHRDRRTARRARAGALSTAVADPVRAQANRVERDRLLAADAVRAAPRARCPRARGRRLGRCEAVADIVAAHFAPYLPPRAR